MESLTNNNQVLITRPVMLNYCPEEGNCIGRIDSVSIEERDSRYSDTGKRATVELMITAFPAVGEVRLTHILSLNWSSKSKLVALLEKLEMLPEPGCDLDLAAFEGIMVDMTLENVTKNGRIFTNVMSIRKRSQSNAAAGEESGR